MRGMRFGKPLEVRTIKLYFICLNGMYVHKEKSCLDKSTGYKIILTIDQKESCYYDKVSPARGMNTKLRKAGYKTYIIEADVVNSKIIGAEIK